MLREQESFLYWNFMTVTRTSEDQFRGVLSFLEAIESKSGNEAFRDSYGGSERLGEHRNHPETFSQSHRKAKLRPGGKKVADKEFRNEIRNSRQPYAFPVFWDLEWSERIWAQLG